MQGRWPEAPRLWAGRYPRSKASARGLTPGLDTRLRQGAATCRPPWVRTLHTRGHVGCALPLPAHPTPPAAPTVPARVGADGKCVPPRPAPTSVDTKSLFSCPFPACAQRQSKRESGRTPREREGCPATAQWQTQCPGAAPAGCQPLGLSELVQYLIHRPGQLFTTGCFTPGRGCTVGQLAQPQLTGHAGWVAGARQGSALPLGAGCGAGLGFTLLHGCCSDACVRAIPRHRGTARTGACRTGVRGVPDLCPLLLHHWSEVSCIPASSIKQQAFQQGKFTLRKCREESKTQWAGRCPGSAWVVSHPFWP